MIQDSTETNDKLNTQLRKILGISSGDAVVPKGRGWPRIHNNAATVIGSTDNLNSQDKAYNFNISNLDTNQEKCVIYMGNTFVLMVPKQTMSYKYRTSEDIKANTFTEEDLHKDTATNCL